MLTLITTGLSFQAGFRAPVSTSAARSMATMDATALKQARTSPLPVGTVFPDSLPVKRMRERSSCP